MSAFDGNSAGEVVVNSQNLEELWELGDKDCEFMGEVVNGYLEDAVGQVEAIGEAVGGADAVLLRESAHALKGSSANLGAERVAEICETLQGMGDEGALEGACELFESLKEAMGPTREVLEGFLVGRSCSS